MPRSRLLECGDLSPLWVSKPSALNVDAPRDPFRTSPAHPSRLRAVPRKRGAEQSCRLPSSSRFSRLRVSLIAVAAAPASSAIGNTILASFLLWLIGSEENGNRKIDHEERKSTKKTVTSKRHGACRPVRGGDNTEDCMRRRERGNREAEYRLLRASASQREPIGIDAALGRQECLPSGGLGRPTPLSALRSPLFHHWALRLGPWSFPEVSGYRAVVGAKRSVIGPAGWRAKAGRSELPTR